MKKILTLLLCFGLFACENAESVTINDTYMVETPATFPAAAIYMIVSNRTGETDRMIDFKTNRAGRVELHTMAIENDIMRMRRVENFEFPSNWDNTVYALSPKGDHIMLFDMPSDFVAGEEFTGTAIFEKSGEIPVTITVKSRDDVHKHNH